MAPDLYAQMAALGAELSDVDRRIDEAVSELRAERATIQARMAALAARLVSDQGEEEANDTQTDEDGGEPDHPLRQAARLPPRRIRLLGLLREYPTAPYEELCAMMYNGRRDRAARRGLSSEFSRLKEDGFVHALDRGRFRLTPRALRALNGGRN